MAPAAPLRGPLAALEATAELGAQHYVIHSGMIPAQQGDGLTAAYDRQREALSRAGDLARQHGLQLCVETLFGGFEGRVHVSTPAQLAAELAAVGHPNVWATIDVSHAYLKLDYDGCRDAFVSEIAALAPWGRHLHIHDSFGRQDDIWMYTEGEKLAYGHGDLHLPVGWGDIPWDALMASCAGSRPRVNFTIELEQRYLVRGSRTAWSARPADWPRPAQHGDGPHGLAPARELLAGD